MLKISCNVIREQSRYAFLASAWVFDLLHASHALSVSASVAGWLRCSANLPQKGMGVILGDPEIRIV